MTVAEVVARIQEDLTFTEIAAVLGVSERTLHRWVQDEWRPTKRDVDLLSALLREDARAPPQVVRRRLADRVHAVLTVRKDTRSPASMPVPSRDDRSSQLRRTPRV